MNARKAVVAAIAASLGWSCFAKGSDDRCVVEHPHFGRGETVTATMVVINDGEPCEMHMHFGGNLASSLKILAKPGNGTLVAARSNVAYTPNPGFMGNDSFDVRWFGVGFGPNSPSQNVRTKVEITVRAKSAELPPAQ
jgi:hypothetical protein